MGTRRVNFSMTDEFVEQLRDEIPSGQRSEWLENLGRDALEMSERD